MRRVFGLALGAVVLVALAPAGWSQAAPADKRYHAGKVLVADDFRHGLDAWRVEMERAPSGTAGTVTAGSVTAGDGVLDIDVPAGVTVWFRQELDGPVMIQYEATAISAGGANDRVSDLNSFWMATDPKSPRGDIFAGRRNRNRGGKFAEYNALDMYYVGLGGNGNTTTRFRRYIDDEVERPLLPQNDLSGPISHSLRRDSDGAILHDAVYERVVRDPHDQEPHAGAKPAHCAAGWGLT